MSRGAKDAAQASRTTGDEASPAAPFFEITGGNPTAEQVGVLAAVFATAQGNAAHGDAGGTAIRNNWGALEDRLRSQFGYNPNSFINKRSY